MASQENQKPALKTYFKGLQIYIAVLAFAFGLIADSLPDESTIVQFIKQKNFGAISLGVAAILAFWKLLLYVAALIKFSYWKFCADVAEKSCSSQVCPAASAEYRLDLMATAFHEINEMYRDHMSKNGTVFDDTAARKPFLEKVCARTARVFEDVWHIDDAVVTVKRAFKKAGESRPKQVYTFARSRPCPERDDGGPDRMNYQVDQNTAFQTAATRAQNGRFYFHSNDLGSTHSNYRNERDTKGDDWKRYYISTIVVPIQCQIKEGSDRELIGFLTIDSLNKDVFNIGSHLNVLAAIADQLFNYFRITDGSTTRQAARKKAR